MNPFQENGNPFFKQVSKLFGDLAPKKNDPLPPSPRVTCTKLRRIREIRCELVELADPDDIEPEGFEANDSDDFGQSTADTQGKTDGMASWAQKSKNLGKLNISSQSVDFLEDRTEIKSEPERKEDCKNTFSNFSPLALQKVAKNPNTPQSTLMWLAAHYRAEVRQSLASNPNINGELMRILAGDVDENVRLTLAENKSLIRELLLKLCDDPNHLVSEKAKNILYALSEATIASKNNGAIVKEESKAQKTKSRAESEIIEREFLQVIAERSTTPPRRLAELATHTDKHIRMAVAGNPNATPEILWKLAKDESFDVRKKLLTNYNCPEEIIDSLLSK